MQACRLMKGLCRLHYAILSLRTVSGGAYKLLCFLLNCGKKSRVLGVQDDDAAFVLRWVILVG